MRRPAVGSIVAPVSVWVMALVGLLALRALACEGNAFTTATAPPATTPPANDASAAPDTSMPPVTITADQGCTDSAHARCAILAKCSQVIVSTTYGDEATCETRLKANCLDELAAKGTGATAASMEACAEALPGETCDQLLDDEPVSACAQQTGARSIGEPCAFSGQCQTGFCATTPGAACGTCQNTPQAGDSCAALTTCGELLTCVSAVSLCEGFSTTTCGKEQPCGAGLSCVGATGAADGTCEPAVETAGNACDPTQKKGAGCDRNALLTCSSVQTSCVALALASPGSPCGVVNGATVLCASAGTCVAEPVDARAGAGAGTGGGVAGTTSTCQAAAADDQACDLAAGPFCVAPARCMVSGTGTSGTCAFVDPAKCQ